MRAEFVDSVVCILPIILYIYFQGTVGSIALARYLIELSLLMLCIDCSLQCKVFV